ncbi:hypothetical protein Kisp01_06120 [Kineosporia sp. NBRC 101677]|uniref:DUF1330 domain-containing protein n=1 Tax=Kineosporia sp. NBRC 101677 TaxID=3032197 RepID=UPI00249FDA45|nr:DUF1330 domain-containing protein [Kineosporia sp. NBRC 101677]GLY13596.1 hypothetical protein Kisp01_06120 [Kineosporia sp. NBRC 101677]
MTAYAIAHFPTVDLNHEVVEYLQRIDATLEPFGGQFLVHGAQTHVLEGEWPGAAVVISFPDLASAQGWYDSPAYQAILPLRLRNSTGSAILVEGVQLPHAATDILAAEAS